MPVGGNTRQLLATWRKHKVLADVRPPSRTDETASLVGDSLYVFGGFDDKDDDLKNDLWKLDLSAPEPRWEELHVTGTPPSPHDDHAAVVIGDRIVFCGGRCRPNVAGNTLKIAVDQHGNNTFYEGGFAMLDITRGRWLQIQHPTHSVYDEDGNLLSTTTDEPDNDDDDERMWEYRTGHVMVPAQRGLLVIGGLGYLGDMLNDVLHVGLF